MVKIVNMVAVVTTWHTGVTLPLLSDQPVSTMKTSYQNQKTDFEIIISILFCLWVVTKHVCKFAMIRTHTNVFLQLFLHMMAPSLSPPLPPPSLSPPSFTPPPLPIPSPMAYRSDAPRPLSEQLVASYLEWTLSFHATRALKSNGYPSKFIRSQSKPTRRPYTVNWPKATVILPYVRHIFYKLDAS